MLRLLGWIIRISLFALVVLVLGNWFQYRGKTLSDQVKTGMAQAERSSIYQDVRGWAKQVTGNPSEDRKRSRMAQKAHPEEADEDLPASERQKLKALIHELNGSESR